MVCNTRQLSYLKSSHALMFFLDKYNLTVLLSPLLLGSITEVEDSKGWVILPAQGWI